MFASQACGDNRAHAGACDELRLDSPAHQHPAERVFECKEPGAASRVWCCAGFEALVPGCLEVWLSRAQAGRQVFRNVGYDQEEITGFAFGMGVERIAMIKFGIDDIRQFYYNDVRFLAQF